MGPLPDPDEPSAAETLERSPSPRGELALRRRGSHFELVSNGVFLMDTTGGGRSERLLATATLEAAGQPRRVLVGGLGVGYTTAAALAAPSVVEVVVVEVEPTVIRWQREHFSRHAGAVQRDGRCRVVEADLWAWLGADPGSYDALCVDVDNGPQWTVTQGNARLYDPAGVDLLAARLRDGGALGIWAAAPDRALEQTLRARFATVRRHEVPVARGVPDVVVVAADPR